MNIVEHTTRQYLDDLKRSIDLRQLAETLLGPPAKRNTYFAPWRDDGRTASLAIYPDGFKDFGGSGERGDAITLVQRVLNLSFAEALAWLQHWCGVSTVGNFAIPQRPSVSAAEPPSAAWQECLKHVLEEAQTYLWSTALDAQRVRAYLHSTRGLTDETIRHFGLGYNPKSRNIHWLNPLTHKREKVWVQAGILIPRCVNGALWCVRIRCRVGNLATALGQPPDSHRGHDNEEQPVEKYLSVTGSKVGVFFNGDKLTPGAEVLFVEGEFDAMLAQQLVGESVIVVTMGSASSSPNKEQRERLKAAARVYLLLDEDATGQAAAKKLAAMVGNQAQHLHLSKGKDVTEYVVEQKGDLITWFKAAVQPILTPLVSKIALPMEANAVYWLEGVPDGFRSGILNAFPPSCILAVQLINRAIQQGKIDPTNFRLATLMEFNRSQPFPVAESTLRNAIKTLKGYYWQKLESKDSPDPVSNFCEKTKRGRPSEQMCLLPVHLFRNRIMTRIRCQLLQDHFPTSGENALITSFNAQILIACKFDPELAEIAAEIIQEFLASIQEQQGEAGQKAVFKFEQDVVRWERTLCNPHSTPLSTTYPQNSTCLFRAVLLHNIVAADPDKPRSIKDQAWLLGVAPSSLKATRTRARVENIKRSTNVKIVATGENRINQIIKHKGGELRGYPVGIKVCDRNDQSPSWKSMGEEGEAAKFIDAQIRKGRKVYVRFQLASKQKIVGEILPISKKSAPEPPQKDIAQVQPKLPTAPAKNVPVLQSPLEITKPQSVPRRRRYYGEYDPLWIEGLLKLVFHWHGWVSGVHFIDPDTGEVFLETPSPAVLVGILLKQAQASKAGNRAA